MRDIYEIFDTYDLEKKMYWGPDEIKSFMKAYNYECTKSTSFHLFNQVDVNGEGRVEFEDFFEFITSTRPMTENVGKLKNIFYKFSKGKEFIDKDDMVRICRDQSINITEDQAKDMFYKISPSAHPDKITFKTFEKIVQQSSGDRMKTS